MIKTPINQYNLCLKTHLNCLKLSDSIFIKSNSLYHRIELEDIKYIQSDGNYATIYVEESKFIIKKSLVNLLDELGGDFAQVHKRFIINTNRITKLDITNSKLFIDDFSITIGRSFKSSLIEQLNFI